ncbi:MAG: sugar nucleotide-binding protein [Nitrosomonadales bacterium]|nr:sugar nucleotide-binding protein [Nitrosomonadales bacterium]MBT6356089.1 sugar nucleotide-binding protein [Nitrosomonadales bacterium]
MEIKNKKLLVIGCGKLGQKLGLLAKKTPLDLLGFKRKKITSTNIRIEQQDIFDKSFFDKVKIHSPDFILYSLSADEQSEKSYRRNYIEGLKQVIKSIKYINNFQHLFFVSSTSVYGDNNDQFIDEFSETSPKNFRGTILLEAENLLNTVKFNSTILRLSGIYGSGRNYMIKLSQDAESWPKVDRWTNRINEDDAANFIIFLLNQCLQGEIPEKLYLLTDKEPVTLFRLLNWIRQNLNLKNKINITSDPILGKRLRSSIIPSLKFEYKYPTYKQGYKELIQEAKKNL